MYVALFRHHPVAPLQMNVYLRPSDAIDFRDSYVLAQGSNSTCVILVSASEKELIEAIVADDQKLIERLKKERSE